MILDKAIALLRTDAAVLRNDATRLEEKMAEPDRRPCELRKLGRDRDIATESADAITVVLAKLVELMSGSPDEWRREMLAGSSEDNDGAV